MKPKTSRCYSPEESKVVEYLLSIFGEPAAGEDPIGFLLTEHDIAITAHDTAIGERDTAIEERLALQTEVERLRSELSEMKLARSHARGRRPARAEDFPHEDSTRTTKCPGCFNCRPPIEPPPPGPWGPHE